MLESDGRKNITRENENGEKSKRLGAQASTTQSTKMRGRAPGLYVPYFSQTSDTTRQDTSQEAVSVVSSTILARETGTEHHVDALRRRGSDPTPAWGDKARFLPDSQETRLPPAQLPLGAQWKRGRLRNALPHSPRPHQGRRPNVDPWNATRVFDYPARGRSVAMKNKEKKSELVSMLNSIRGITDDIKSIQTAQEGLKSDLAGLKSSILCVRRDTSKGLVHLRGLSRARPCMEADTTELCANEADPPGINSESDADDPFAPESTADMDWFDDFNQALPLGPSAATTPETCLESPHPEVICPEGRLGQSPRLGTAESESMSPCMLTHAGPVREFIPRVAEPRDAKELPKLLQNTVRTSESQCHDDTQPYETQPYETQPYETQPCNNSRRQLAAPVDKNVSGQNSATLAACLRSFGLPDHGTRRTLAKRLQAYLAAHDPA